MTEDKHVYFAVTREVKEAFDWFRREFTKTERVCILTGLWVGMSYLWANRDHLENTEATDFPWQKHAEMLFALMGCPGFREIRERLTDRGEWLERVFEVVEVVMFDGKTERVN